MLIQTKKLYLTIFITFLIITTLSLSLYSFATNKEDDKHVLFICSNGYDCECVPEQLEGFSTAIDKDISVEYSFMNANHLSYENARNELLNKIKNEPENYKKFDCVVASDDNALSFIMENKDKYFDNPSVVFLSINDMNKAKESAQDPMVTGIIERGYYYDTLKMARQIYSNATKVVAITDNAKKGICEKERFESSISKLSDLPHEYINTSELTKAEIIKRLQDLDEKAILFYLNFSNDKDGNEYTEISSSKLVHNYSSVPAFSTDLEIIKSGLLGGKVLNFNTMAEEAAIIVNDILSGKKPSQIPVHFSNGIVYLNNKVMDDFNVHIPAIISGKAVHLNLQKSFLGKNYEIIFFISSFLCVVLFILMFIVYRINYNRRNALIQKLEQANTTKSEFLSRMSHSMRTPLNSVIGLCNFGIDENRDSTDSDYFRQIRNSSNFLLCLLNDILDMQKIESDEIILNPEVVKVVDVICRVNALVENDAKEKSIALIINYDNLTGIEYDKIDVVRIQQILVNLLDNAIKFTPKGGYIEWTVSPYTDIYGNLWTVQKIKDTGIGISEDFIEYIFAPFTQGYTTQNQFGTGLGLSIVKNLVTNMGGTISVKSKPKKGSTFTVILPHTEVTKEEINEYKAYHKGECRKNLAGKHILVCEDIEINAKILEKILQKEGVVVSNVGNGQEAIDKAKQSSYDSILMDIRMPYKDGITATKTIRTFDKVTPIIGLSSHKFSDIELSQSAGMQALLSKPIDTIQLLNTLYKYCK